MKPLPQIEKSSLIIGDIKDNTNTQINVNSPNSTQIINDLRTLSDTYTVQIRETEGIFITRIIMRQTPGIWNLGTFFKFHAQISVPYTSYAFVKGFPPIRMNWRTRDNPDTGTIFVETTTAPNPDEDIILEIKSNLLPSIQAIAAEPAQRKWLSKSNLIWSFKLQDFFRIFRLTNPTGRVFYDHILTHRTNWHR